MFDNESILKCEPQNFDRDAAFDRELADAEGYTDTYFALQAYYAEALFEYLDARCELRAVDQALGSNDMQLIPVSDLENVYQQRCAFGMRFLFLRSNICIERLTYEALDTLRQAQASGMDCTSDEVQKLIEESFAEVTMLDPNKTPTTKIIFEPDGKAPPNQSIMIGFSMDEAYDEDGNFIDPQHEVDKVEFIKFALPKLADLLTEKLGYPVSLFNY